MKNHVKLSEGGIIVICIILSAAILGVDAFTPAGVNTALLYLITVFLGLSTERIRTAITFSMTSSFLTVLGLFVSIDNGALVEGMINRALVLCAIWAVVVIGIRFKKIQEEVWILAAMAESAQDSIVGKNRKGKVIFWNTGAEKLYGYTAKEMIGRSITTLFPDELKYEEGEFLKKLQKGKPLINYETVRQRKDGTKINVSLSISPITSFAGKFIGASTITRDITQAKEREHEKEQRLVKLQKNIKEQEKKSRNLEENILSKTKELKEREGKLHEMIRECGRMEQKFVNAQEEVGELEDEIQDQNKLLEKRNKELESEIEGHKKTEKILRESQRRLKDLGAHLTRVREQERSTMAREIHDELGQLLTAIKMDLSWFEDNAFNGDRGKYLKRIEETGKLIDTTISSIHQIVAKLRPSILDDLGVIEAIKWQAKEFEKRSNIQCSVSINSNGTCLSDNASTALFRIFQESLTNVARHAQASRVEINLDSDEKQLQLQIRDNGKGLPGEKLSDAQSFGLMGMLERAEMVSGKISFEGEENKGTTVKICIPLANNKVPVYD